MPRTDMEKRREYDRAWHAKNREARNAVKYERDARRRERWREFKKTLSCERCGFSHYRAIHFHHRDPSQKTLEVGVMACRQYSWARVMEEVAKCDILCANCHAILHADEDELVGPW